MTKSHIKNRVMSVLGSLALSVGGTVVAAAPAHAAPAGYVYLVFSNSNCVGGGTLNQIVGAVDSVGVGVTLATTSSILVST